MKPCAQIILSQKSRSLFHLGHEFGEQHGTSIDIYSLHQAIDCTREASRVRRKPYKIDNRREVIIGIRGDNISPKGGSRRPGRLGNSALPRTTAMVMMMIKTLIQMATLAN